MTFGIKTNERPGSRAQTRYARVSAYKAREVLDLIRGESVARAAELLEFTERDVAQIIVKTLDSAVANAENNDSIPADELYVSACYADEGPTLRRWRPRARGRARRSLGPCRVSRCRRVGSFRARGRLRGNARDRTTVSLRARF